LIPYQTLKGFNKNDFNLYIDLKALPVYVHSLERRFNHSVVVFISIACNPPLHAGLLLFKSIGI